MAESSPNALGHKWRSTVVLKRDVFSTVERGRFQSANGEVDAVMRRIDAVPWWARPIAAHFLRREARALQVAGQLGVAPPLLFLGRDRLVRGYIGGVALKIARPFSDHAYFHQARIALHRLHRANISHNDLAKEQNWLYGVDGRPYLLDFQLASRFKRRHRLFRLMAYEDLRHLLKHKRKYLPDALSPSERKLLARKAWPTRIWMATGKRIYLVITRGLFGIRDAEGGGTRLAQEAPKIEAALRAHPHVRDAVVVEFIDRRFELGLYAFVEGSEMLTEPGLAASLAQVIAPMRPPEHLQLVRRLPRDRDGDARSDVLRLIATNQVDLIDQVIRDDAEREVARAIALLRKNLYDVPEIVAALRSHPLVRDAAVLPFPDRIAGTGLYAFVEAEAKLSQPSVRDFVISALGKEKVPQHIQLVPTLPRRADGVVRTDILQFIATNQVDGVDALITSETERRIVNQILQERQNLRDRFFL